MAAAYRRFMALDKPTWAAVQAGDLQAAKRIALGQETRAFKKLETAAAEYVRNARFDQDAKVPTS